MMETIWYSFLIGILAFSSMHVLYSFYMTVRNDLRDERERKEKLKAGEHNDHR